MKSKLLKANVLVFILMLAIFPVLVPVTGNDKALADDTTYSFDYTITAAGTEDVTTYPDQSFNWTITTTGTENWTEYDPCGSRAAGISGYHQSATLYLIPPSGYTITDWYRTDIQSQLGGCDSGTYISGNRLVIRIFSGGEVLWIMGMPFYIPGAYSAEYHINGTKAYSVTLSYDQAGSGTVNATEGNKFIGNFSLAPPPPEHGGTVTLTGRTLTDDNPDVTTSMAGNSVYASTNYEETVSQPWSDTETGSATVSVSEGDKYVTTSTLVAPNGDTSWSVTDDHSFVDTWMDGSDLYAKANANSVLTCDVDGNEKEQFAPGESVYVKAGGFEANAEYKLWIQEDGVAEGDDLVEGEDPSGGQEEVTTDADGNLSPALIWTIPSDTPLDVNEWDVVMDRKGDGENTYNVNSDGIDSASTVGFVAPVPELPTIVLFGIGLLGIFGYAGYRKSRSKGVQLS